MLKKSLVVALVAACYVGTAAADIVCPDSSYCVVNFATTKNRVTIAPNGAGETFAVLADGVALCTIPVKTNSPDAVPASPCAVDASDLGSLATHLGNSLAY